MSRFIFWTIALMFVGGAMLHFRAEIPLIQDWFGKLPGDMIVTKGKMRVYLPLVSSSAVAVIVTFVTSLIFPLRKR